MLVSVSEKDIGLQRSGYLFDVEWILVKGTCTTFMRFGMTVIANFLLTVRSVEGVFDQQFPTQAVVLDLALLSSVIARRRR